MTRIVQELQTGRKLLIGLIAAVALQLLVLIGMQVSAALPLWTGTEVRVRTVPVDPRSLFRGNYARLGYEFSRFPAESLSEEFSAQYIRTGELVPGSANALASITFSYQ